MVKAPNKALTLLEFLELPETKPASEYIDGAIIQKPVPQGKHSILQRELSFFLTTRFRVENNAQAFPELRCTFGARSLVPDIAVFRSERIPRDSDGEVANRFDLHPDQRSQQAPSVEEGVICDWIIEILSPNQSQTKVVCNILHCLDYGTEMGWLLDPEESCLFVYDASKSVQAVTN